ncbi:MAG: heparan N-sulfatase, partial [Planctomycetes bacterium]|nr:heparan N-sulfatase [Planctomycetota bacterium]
ARVKAGRQIDDFVSFTDFAPTFLEAAGVPIPKEMTGRSLLPILLSPRSGRIDPARDHVLVGKERHVPAQEAPDWGGYPCRGLRTHQFFYIRNFRPDRWPCGTPNYRKAVIPGAWYADTDNGPTKTYMIENKDKDPLHRRLYELAFAKRPAEELYDLKADPDQLQNVATDPRYSSVKQRLADQLMQELRATGDPRAFGRGDVFDKYPYLGGAPKFPGWKEPKKKRAR